MNTLDKARRAALKQELKTTMPAMGVYMVKNTVTGRTLLAASKNMDGAINRHRFELQLGGHRHKALMSEWRSFGANAFVFEPVDRIEQRNDPDFDYDTELKELLELWQEKFSAEAVPMYDPVG